MPTKLTPPNCHFETNHSGMALSWRVRYTANKLPREVEQGDPPDSIEVEADEPELVAVNGVLFRGLQPGAAEVDDECRKHFQRIARMYRDE